MKILKQFAALLQMSLRGLQFRLGTVLVSIIGTTCVVGVLISMLSMGAGARAKVMQNVRADRAWVLKHGAQGNFDSSLPRNVVPIIEDMPGIKKDTDGKTLAYASVIEVVEGRKKIDNSRANFGLIGVSDGFLAVNPNLRLTAGRMFRPGVRELIAGKSRHELFKNFEIGDQVRLRGNYWTVVGHYQSGGFFDDSLMGDAPTVMSAFRNGAFNTVTVMLESPAAFEQLQNALKANPSIDVDVRHEIDLMREQSKQLSGIMDFVSYFVGVTMAIGATLGAINAMYAIVDSRRRELATLRAIGFGVWPVILAVLAEALILVLPGAAIGALAAWVLFNGHVISPGGMSFSLSVTPGLVMLGIGWALAMGLIGGLLPALRAANASVTQALRAT
jgi:putative ABC transport system permease protein